MTRSFLLCAGVACLVFFTAFSRTEAAVATEPVIVVLGDSLAAGLGLPRDQSFPVQLEKALRAKGHAVTVVDAGVSGDTATDGLDRIDWAIPDNASAVIVELGANDALQGLPPEMTKQALEEIIKRLQAKKLPILLAGMEAPRNLGQDYVEDFKEVYLDLISRYDVVFYPFFLDGLVGDPSLAQSDGMHPSAKGVTKIVEGILPKVEELLARVNAKKPLPQ
jgi:acyl-CoA thioesterase I